MELKLDEENVLVRDLQVTKWEHKEYNVNWPAVLTHLLASRNVWFVVE